MEIAQGGEVEMNENTPLPAAPGQPVGYQRRTIILGAVVLLLVIATGAAWEFSAWRALFFYGIRTNKVFLVRIMLRAGADPNLTPRGEPPLDAAMEGPDQSLAMVRLLLEFHADPNHPGWGGRTALERVDGPDALAIFDALLAAGANIKACSPAGTLLHQPLAYAEFILSRGADVNQICQMLSPFLTPCWQQERISKRVPQRARFCISLWPMQSSSFPAAPTSIRSARCSRHF